MPLFTSSDVQTISWSFLHQTEKFPTLATCITNISATSNCCYLKNEARYFSYRRKIKKLPLHHQAVQSSLCSKLESKASDGLVVSQDKKPHSSKCINITMPLIYLSVLDRLQAIEQHSHLGQGQTTKI